MRCAERALRPKATAIAERQHTGYEAWSIKFNRL